MKYLNQESVIRLNPKRRVQDCQARDGRKENFPKGRTLPEGWDFFFFFLFYSLMHPLSLATYWTFENLSI